MKKSIFLLSFCLLFSIQNISAQSLTEKLGGTITNFQMTNNGNELEIVSQLIIPRGRSSYRYGSDSSYGYANQVFIFEFISKTEIKEKEEVVVMYTNTRSTANERRKAKVTFYAEDGSVLFEKRYLNLMKEFEKKELGGTEENKLYFYTINLEEYSIALLEKTVRIDFWGEWELSTREKRKRG